MSDIWQKNGVTSLILREKIYDTTLLFGQGKTGLAFNSAGLIISTIADNEASPTTYTQAGGTIETVTTLGTFAAPTATKCRFREVDATNFPGLYELQIADARWAVSGAKYVDVSLPPVSGLGAAPVLKRVQLTADDPQVAKPANFNLLSIDGSGQVLSKVSVWAAGAVQAFFDSVVTFNAAGSVGKLWNDIFTAIKAKTDQLHFTGSAGVEKVNSNAANEVLDALAADHNTPLTIGALINLITGGVASAAAVWNYLVSSLGNTTTVGGWWNSLLVAIKAKTDTIGTSTLTAVSPVTASGNLALVQGDAYLAADGRSLDFVYTGQPSFIGAAALMRFTAQGANSSYNIGTDDVPVYYLTGSVLSATEVQFEMTSAQSARLPANINGGQSARFEVQITLSDGSVITPTPLNQGKVSVSPQAAP